MKLYSKGGDDGTTGLFGGTRVPKDDLRVAAYGQVDEANAAIGQVVADCIEEDTVAVLLTIQSDLFALGAELATPKGSESGPRIGESHVAQLERWIDEACDGVPPLTSFVLPGGTKVAAALHVARTVCRRAERGVVTLAHAEVVDQPLIIYLNRLSDLLFALARRANHRAGVSDIVWEAPRT